MTRYGSSGEVHSTIGSTAPRLRGAAADEVDDDRAGADDRAEVVVGDDVAARVLAPVDAVDDEVRGPEVGAQQRVLRRPLGADVHVRDAASQALVQRAERDVAVAEHRHPERRSRRRAARCRAQRGRCRSARRRVPSRGGTRSCGAPAGARPPARPRRRGSARRHPPARRGPRGAFRRPRREGGSPPREASIWSDRGWLRAACWSAPNASRVKAGERDVKLARRPAVLGEDPLHGQPAAHVSLAPRGPLGDELERERSMARSSQIAARSGIDFTCAMQMSSEPGSMVASSRCVGPLSLITTSRSR